ncbi:MAG: hypothetical protein P1V20_05065 [Verrucomicrobiales bacterium]|nr:hypothetical protein [Verrucomicrobiales bacterium]
MNPTTTEREFRPEVTHQQLDSVLINQRFSLARRWIDCYYEVYGDDCGITSEELICSVMKVIENMVYFVHNRNQPHGALMSGFEDPGELVTQLHEISLLRCNDLLEALKEDSDCITNGLSLEFVSSCSKICNLLQTKAKKSGRDNRKETFKLRPIQSN